LKSCFPFRFNSSPLSQRVERFTVRPAISTPHRHSLHPSTVVGSGFHAPFSAPPLCDVHEKERPYAPKEWAIFRLRAQVFCKASPLSDVFGHLSPEGAYTGPKSPAPCLVQSLHRLTVLDPPLLRHIPPHLMKKESDIPRLTRPLFFSLARRRVNIARLSSRSLRFMPTPLPYKHDVSRTSKRFGSAVPVFLVS